MTFNEDGRFSAVFTLPDGTKLDVTDRIDWSEVAEKFPEFFDADDLAEIEGHAV